MGWKSYSNGGKQNTKGTLLRGAGQWSAQEVGEGEGRRIPSETWERQVVNHPEWSTACRVGLQRFENSRIEQLQETRIAQHAAQNHSVPNTDYVCPDCQRHCHSSIGLISHRRKHATLLN